MSEPAQLPLRFEHRSALTGADFLVAECNRTAVEWIDRWPDWPGPALAIHGPAGCGKSHLASVFREKTGAQVVDPTRIAENWDETTETPWIIDGVRHCLDETGEESLLHFYNTVVEHGGTILCVEREPPSRWSIALADLRSRLNAASAVEIAAPDDELLAAILVKLLSDRQLRVGLAVIDYVLPRMERSFAAAGDLVEALDRLALAERREITVPLARRVLGEG